MRSQGQFKIALVHLLQHLFKSTFSDTNNNSENPCESSISDCSHGAMENTDKKAKSKEKRDQNDEEACTEDENDSEVSSVFGDDLIPEGKSCITK